MLKRLLNSEIRLDTGETKSNFERSYFKFSPSNAEKWSSQYSEDLYEYTVGFSRYCTGIYAKRDLAQTTRLGNSLHVHFEAFYNIKK